VRVYLYHVGRNLNRSIRLCEAMGVDELCLVECDGAEVRGNMYQAQSLPVVTADEIADEEGTVALVPPRRTHEATLPQFDWRNVRAIAVGGETDGLPRLRHCRRIAIPMYGEQREHTVEVALSIALWEWRRSAPVYCQSSYRRDVVVDLDDTLCRMPQPFAAHVYGEPMPGAVDAVRALREQGRKVVVHTARDHSEHDGIAAHLSACGITVDSVVCGKPSGTLYVDDKALRFTGDWQAVLREAMI
jgi:hypothetical protein